MLQIIKNRIITYSSKQYDMESSTTKVSTQRIEVIADSLFYSELAS